MIQIKFKEFRVGPFMPVFQKLTTFDKYPQKMLYNVTKLAKKLDSAHEEWNEQFIALVNKYALKDEAGKIIPRKNQQGKEIPNSFDVDPAQEEAWKTEIEALDEKGTAIDRKKLSIGDLIGSGLGLTPQECIILDDILDDEEEPAGLKAVQ